MAAINLKNSAFIHIPKCGGRSVSNILRGCVKGARNIGDPVYDAHTTPDIGDKVAILFVRHPITMLNSLWEHRGRKASNKRWKPWNWQSNIEVEHICGCDDLEKFFECVSKHPGIVESYYYHWIDEYTPRVMVGRVEKLYPDLVHILRSLEEPFDEKKVKQMAQHVLGKGSHKQALQKIIQNRFDLIETIMENEREFCHRFHYSLDTL